MHAECRVGWEGETENIKWPCTAISTMVQVKSCVTDNNGKRGWLEKYSEKKSVCRGWTLGENDEHTQMFTKSKPILH